MQTKLPVNKDTKVLFELIKRAENWLKTNSYKNPILKWETKAWGEIPADLVENKTQHKISVTRASFELS